MKHRFIRLHIMKSKSSQSKVSPQQRSALHKTHAITSKHGAESSLHKLAESALDKVVKTGGKMSSAKVLVGLEMLSDGLLNRVVELEQREAETKAMERTIWEGRFCDYLAKCLAILKSTQAWQPWGERHRRWAWVSHGIGLDAAVDTVIKHASKETK
jgi:hypothetical protein